MKGTVVSWNNDRGFGFIRPFGPKGDVFFHVRDFRAAGMVLTPRLGMEVNFEQVSGDGKGPRAVAVQPMTTATVPSPGEATGIPLADKTPGRRATARNAPVRGARVRQPEAMRQGTPPSSGGLIALPLMLAYAVAVAWGVWAGRLPFWVLPALPVLNLLTFFAYWQDKYAAGKGQWRTKEDVLHLFGLVGGWPGAWLAHQVLRHKSRKRAFRVTYWITVVLHCIALGAWLGWAWSAPRPLI